MEQQPNHHARTRSRTAQALDAISSMGISVREAAKMFDITPQAIYRLIAYRRQRPPCPVCGR